MFSYGLVFRICISGIIILTNFLRRSLLPDPLVAAGLLGLCSCKGMVWKNNDTVIVGSRVWRSRDTVTVGSRLWRSGETVVVGNFILALAYSGIWRLIAWLFFFFFYSHTERVFGGRCHAGGGLTGRCLTGGGHLSYCWH